MSLLSLAGVRSFYGNVEALKGVDLDVGEGEIVALIGANGAGKSTLLMTICGVLQARHGAVHFAGATSRACAPSPSCGSASRKRPKGAACFRA